MKNKRRTTVTFIIAMFLVGVLIISIFSSCEAKRNDIETELEEQRENGINEHIFFASAITVKNTENGMSVSLDEETVTKVISVLNESTWKNDNTKTYCPYIFNVDDRVNIYYSSEAGLFNDNNNGIHLVLNQSQKEYINSIINATQINDQTSEEAFIETTDTDSSVNSTDTSSVTEKETESNIIPYEIKNGMSYDDVVAILGVEYTELESNCFWTLSDGSTLQVSFDKSSIVNDVYNYTVRETGIKRPADISEVERITVAYMGYKATEIEISDAQTISEIIEMIKNTESNYIESTRGYYGCEYNISIVLKSGETFYFDIWSKNMYSTNEYKSNDNYSMISYIDVSELYNYMKEHFPEEMFRSK